MKRYSIWGACLVASFGLAQLTLLASGSIGPGAGKVSPRAAYSQGKSLTFDHLVCGSCPISKGELDRDRAESVNASLTKAHVGGQTGAADDQLVKALCGDSAAASADCKTKMELVHYYLARRYKL